MVYSQGFGPFCSSISSVLKTASVPVNFLLFLSFASDNCAILSHFFLGRFCHSVWAGVHRLGLEDTFFYVALDKPTALAACHHHMPTVYFSEPLQLPPSKAATALKLPQRNPKFTSTKVIAPPPPPKKRSIQKTQNWYNNEYSF